MHVAAMCKGVTHLSSTQQNPQECIGRGSALFRPTCQQPKATHLRRRLLVPAAVVNAHNLPPCVLGGLLTRRPTVACPIICYVGHIQLQVPLHSRPRTEGEKGIKRWTFSSTLRANSDEAGYKLQQRRTNM